MDEVEVLAKLDHPNIVRYHDCFSDEVYLNIVMEHCGGGDLAGLIRARRGVALPEDDVMALFVQVLLALHYVHSQGILHRDLKPSNVLIGSGGVLKLGDFGVSKMSNTDASMASTIVGTPHYLSPEMCDNRPYGRKSDVWALGCLLVELTTLQKAFESSSISKIILSIISGRHRPIPESYSPGLRALAGALLQVAPAGRPATGEVLAMPFVRAHVQRYLEWARAVPEARLDVVMPSLLASPLLGSPLVAAPPAPDRPRTAAARCPGLTPVQEQLEGLRRLRRLKGRLQVSLEGGSSLGSPVYLESLEKAMSIDSEATAAAAGRGAGAGAAAAR